SCCEGGGNSGDEGAIHDDAYAVAVEHAGFEVGGQMWIGVEGGCDERFVTDAAQMSGDPAGAPFESALVDFYRGQAAGAPVADEFVLGGVDADFVRHGRRFPCRSADVTLPLAVVTVQRASGTVGRRP
ncbi:MAG: hypothetical protein OXE57_19340, partial [Alphaproteobacteria bacterium]|nr:hypothetical protein [Alphaproteobacteria bacterium]